MPTLAEMAITIAAACRILMAFLIGNALAGVTDTDHGKAPPRGPSALLRDASESIVR